MKKVMDGSRKKKSLRESYAQTEEKQAPMGALSTWREKGYGVPISVLIRRTKPVLLANDTVPRAPEQIKTGFKAITPPHHVPLF